MIYKVICKINDYRIFEELSKKFNVYYKNNILYMYQKDYKMITTNKIKKILKSDNIYIEEINEQNLKYEPEDVKFWCRDVFVDIDLKRYEQEHQEEIKNYMNILDVFENNLIQILQTRGGAENGSEGKTKKN